MWPKMGETAKKVKKQSARRSSTDWASAVKRFKWKVSIAGDVT